MSPRITNRVSSYGWPCWSMLVCQTSSTGTPGKAIGWAIVALVLCTATGASVTAALIITVIFTLISGLKS